MDNCPWIKIFFRNLSSFLERIVLLNARAKSTYIFRCVAGKAFTHLFLCPFALANAWNAAEGSRVTRRVLGASLNAVVSHSGRGEADT